MNRGSAATSSGPSRTTNTPPFVRGIRFKPDNAKREEFALDFVDDFKLCLWSGHAEGLHEAFRDNYFDITEIAKLPEDPVSLSGNTLPTLLDT